MWRGWEKGISAASEREKNARKPGGGGAPSLRHPCSIQAGYGAEGVPLLCAVLVQDNLGDGGSRVGRLPRLPALVRTEIKGGVRQHIPTHAVHLSG